MWNLALQEILYIKILFTDVHKQWILKASLMTGRQRAMTNENMSLGWVEKQEHISLIQSSCRVLKGRSNNINFLDHPNLESKGKKRLNEFKWVQREIK